MINEIQVYLINQFVTYYHNPPEKFLTCYRKVFSKWSWKELFFSVKESLNRKSVKKINPRIFK